MQLNKAIWLIFMILNVSCAQTATDLKDVHRQPDIAQKSIVKHAPDKKSEPVIVKPIHIPCTELRLYELVADIHVVEAEVSELLQEIKVNQELSQLCLEHLFSPDFRSKIHQLSLDKDKFNCAAGFLTPRKKALCLLNLAEYQADIAETKMLLRLKLSLPIYLEYTRWIESSLEDIADIMSQVSVSLDGDMDRLVNSEACDILEQILYHLRDAQLTFYQDADLFENPMDICNSRIANFGEIQD
jgi:hypothetical protein